MVEVKSSTFTCATCWIIKAILEFSHGDPFWSTTRGYFFPRILLDFDNISYNSCDKYSVQKSGHFMAAQH